MTAAVLYGKEDVKIERVPIPRVGDGEVLVKVQVALTCGTDLKVYQRGYHARMIVPPALFGHELAGVPGMFLSVPVLAALRVLYVRARKAQALPTS